MSPVGWLIERELRLLNEAICAAERDGGAGHTVLVIPHDPRQPVEISLDGKPISRAESPERVVSVAMMMRNVDAGPAHTMAPLAPNGTAHPPLTGAEVDGMLEYGKIRREVPAESLTAGELDARIIKDDADPTVRYAVRVLCRVEPLDSAALDVAAALWPVSEPPK